MTIFLGEKIKNLRQEKSLSQLALSSDILSRSTLSKIETNKILPSLEQLMYLADELDVPISYFFSNKDIPTHDCDIFKSINELYQNKKYFDIITYYESKQSDNEFIYYYFIGMSYFYIDIFDKASKSLKKFISKYKNQCEKIKSTYVEQVAIALNTLSKILLKNKNYRKALKYLFIADNYLKSYSNKDKKIYFIVNNNISVIYSMLHEYFISKQHLQDFLSNNLDLHYATVMSSIYINLNICCFCLKEYSSAIDYVVKAIFYYNLTDRTYDEGESYINYLNALRYSHKFEESLDLIDMLTHSNSYSKELVEIYKLQRLIVYYNKNDFIYVLNNYMQININLLRKKSLMDYYFICGYVEYYKSDYKKCHTYFLKCEQYLIKKDRFLDLSVIYNIFADILEAEEYNSKSIHYKELYTSMNSPLSVNITLPD